MTAQNAAVADTTSNAANRNSGEKWYNRFGTLRNVRTGKSKNKASYVAGEIVADNGLVFPFQTFNLKMVNLLLSLGDGQKVSLRGPLKPWEFTRKTEAGGTYKEVATMFVPMMDNPPKDAPDTQASDAGAAPAGSVAANVDEEIPF